MGILKEFKEFAVRGNVIDLAVGVIIGGAFGKIVTSVVNDLLMPVVGSLLGNTKFNDLAYVLKEKVVDEAGNTVHEAVTLNYGNFIQTMVDFTIIAFCIFLLVKGINRLKKSEEVAEAPPAPPAAPQPSNEEKLLTEIRDLLKKNN